MSNHPEIEGGHVYHDALKDAIHEKDYNLHHDHHSVDAALQRIHTAGGLTTTAELFEKIYLSPKNRVSNNFRSTFGNPTPLALVGFLLSLTPLSNVLLGWRGAGGLGAAENGVYYFFGGLLMILGALLEFVLGNTFPCVVFGTFGAFWLSFAATLTPFYNASIAYLPDDPTNAASDPTFLATFGYFHLYMGLICFLFMIVALRTNVVFVLIFALLVPAFGCLVGHFWKAAEGNVSPKLLHTAGGLCFAVALLGWYLLTVQLFVAVDFPLNLPVGDLSNVFKSTKGRVKRD